MVVLVVVFCFVYNVAVSFHCLQVASWESIL